MNGDLPDARAPALPLADLTPVADQGFAALYAKARLPAPFLPAFRAALAALEANDPPRGDKISRGLCEKVIAACEARAEVGQGPMLALLWRFASEAARAGAREYADEAWRAPPPRLERPNYAPLLIEAVAAALEEFDAPPVEAGGVVVPPPVSGSSSVKRLDLT